MSMMIHRAIKRISESQKSAENPKDIILNVGKQSKVGANTAKRGRKPKG